MRVSVRIRLGAMHDSGRRTRYLDALPATIQPRPIACARPVDSRVAIQGVARLRCARSPAFPRDSLWRPTRSPSPVSRRTSTNHAPLPCAAPVVAGRPRHGATTGAQSDGGAGRGGGSSYEREHGRGDALSYLLCGGCATNCLVDHCRAAVAPAAQPHAASLAVVGGGGRGLGRDEGVVTVDSADTRRFDHEEEANEDGAQPRHQHQHRSRHHVTTANPNPNPSPNSTATATDPAPRPHLRQNKHKLKKRRKAMRVRWEQPATACRVPFVDAAPDSVRRCRTPEPRSRSNRPTLTQIHPPSR